MEEGVVEDGVVAGAADLVVAAEVQAEVEVGFQDPDRLQIPDHPLAQVSIAILLLPPTTTLFPGGTGDKSSYPKQQWSSGGSKPKTPIGGGGFVNPKVTSYGSSFGGSKTSSYKSPGYGTNFGTSFKGGVGKYGGKGFSKKALGLGVGAGFLGGAALGAAGTVATMGVYHRYLQYRLLLGGLGWNSHYYNHYYYGNQCFGGCPWAAHCEWGFCECNRGYERRYGSCVQDWNSASPRSANFDPFVSCTEGNTCQRIGKDPITFTNCYSDSTLDMNLVCNTNLTTSGEGRCECRRDMKWNKG